MGKRVKARFFYGRRYFIENYFMDLLLFEAPEFKSKTKEFFGKPANKSEKVPVGKWKDDFPF